MRKFFAEFNFPTLGYSSVIHPWGIFNFRPSSSGPSFSEGFLVETVDASGVAMCEDGAEEKNTLPLFWSTPQEIYWALGFAE
ncbi:Hypothetical protein NTJ_08754 [Nesidiocoris tenuis]|uniref:Uncharacterized protein n=1 Tax=Nesidiocoris tenuis TaxID=355587 RepID=A0ABN7AUU7_9HEMI|nr:Hypothetical protein NTJ_08754 [Nesidiocoris tenuis]